MFTGQLCLLSTRPGFPDTFGDLSGWFFRLRDSDDSATVKFFKAGTDLKVDDALVDATLRNHQPDRPYVVDLVVPTDVMVKNCHIGDDLLAEVCMHDLMKEMIALEDKRATLNEKLEAAQAEADALKARSDELLQVYKEASEGDGIPKFYYAFGKHKADGPEYCWRVPNHLKDVVKPGMTAVVQARGGVDTCVITRVDIVPQLHDHKLLVSVQSDMKEP